MWSLASAPVLSQGVSHLSGGFFHTSTTPSGVPVTLLGRVSLREGNPFSYFAKDWDQRPSRPSVFLGATEDLLLLVDAPSPKLPSMRLLPPLFFADIPQTFWGFVEAIERMRNMVVEMLAPLFHSRTGAFDSFWNSGGALYVPFIEIPDGGSPSALQEANFEIFIGALELAFHSLPPKSLAIWRDHLQGHPVASLNLHP